MTSYAEEFCKSLAGAKCYVEGIVCGLCAASAHQMLQISQEPFVLDSLQSRWGSGIAHLAKDEKADLIIIMAGTNDLPIADGQQIFESLRGLHTVCHRLGIPTVALGIPDSGGRTVKRLGVCEARRYVNSMLSSWVKDADKDHPVAPETFVNSMALMPFGPQSRKAKYWESDCTHFSALGAKQLGARLAEILQPLMVRPSLLFSMPDFFSSRTTS